MAGYWIVRASNVTDEDAQREYGKAWAPIAERYHAKIIAGGKRAVTKEGEAVARAVIVEFPSFEQALACYEDPDYLAAAEHGKRASRRDIVIVEGT